MMGGTLAAWFWLIGDIESAPKAVDVSTSHVVPFNDHGIIHYITPQQNLLLYGFIPIIVSLMLAGAALVLPISGSFLKPSKKT
jgi:hypothetical protein